MAFPSLKSLANTYSSVQQSSSLTITSWETSTSLLVKYPESVLRAVSESPFLEPWVEIKNSCTERPSLKFALIGISTILPVAELISPRIPANCLIWLILPLAPESAMIEILFVGSCFSTRIFVISSVALVQTEITYSYLSCSETKPSLNNSS